MRAVTARKSRKILISTLDCHSDFPRSCFDIFKQCFEGLENSKEKVKTRDEHAVKQKRIYCHMMGFEVYICSWLGVVHDCNILRTRSKD